MNVHLRTLGLAAVAAFAVIETVPLAAAGDRYRQVDADEVDAMLHAGSVRVFDVNPRDVYEKNHVPGAVHVGNQALRAILPADKKARIVFYCAGPK